MQGSLKTLIAGYAQMGRVDWIGIRHERRADMLAVPSVDVTPRGLQGDHGASDKRAVTLIQAEHMPAIAGFLGGGLVSPLLLRRNLVIRGLNLSALKGRQIQLGQVVLEVTGICAPCSRMEEALGTGGYSAMRGHGGWCARVITPGLLALGDPVEPLTTLADTPL